MEFRKTTAQDISQIMKIIGQAQMRLKEKGIDQWQNGYPDEQRIVEDIEQGYSYVLCKDHSVVGTVAISFDGEHTYQNIYEGNWKTDTAYAVIHRIAVDLAYKGEGLGAKMISYAEQLCLSRNVHAIRVDTHELNSSMRTLLERCNFSYCGIIYLDDQSKRVAYDKSI